MNLDNYIKKRVKYRIITADTCVYCDKAKKLMKNFNIDYEEHNVSNNDIREDFKKQGFKTVPQIWNETNEHIGGYDDLKSYIYDSQWKHIDGYKGE